MIRAVAVLLTAVVLVSCARLSPQSPDLTDASSASSELLERWQQHRNALLPVTHWQLRAKVGLKAGRRGDTASVYWQRDNADHNIEVYGPLGGGRMRMILSSGGARLTDNKNRTRTADSANDLFQEVVGWHVPFDELTFWAKGLPAPGPVDAHQFMPEGVLANLSQRGWRVMFSDYRLWDGVLLPARIRAESLPGSVKMVDAKGRVADQLIVKVVAKSWKFLER